MKQKIVDTFEQVTMSADCERKIRRAMARKQPRRSYPMLKRAGALAAALAVVLCISPQARAALGHVVEKYLFPESGITIYEGMDDNGIITDITVVDTEVPAFAQLRDGRLYFVGNGEDIDITEEIREDAPFFYTYEDDYGLTHYMAVGYGGSLENFGIYEFIREADGTWVTGTGRNFLDRETETRYPWVDIVWQELDIPWPKPGNQSNEIIYVGGVDVNLTENDRLAG